MRFKLVLAGVLIAGGAIGFVMPLLSAGGLAHGDGAPLAAGAAQGGGDNLLVLNDGQQDGQQDGWDDTITIPRESDGHFYADIAVDGQNTRMLIDTGASVIALTGEDASALGLGWDEAEIAPVAQGANGPVMGVRAVLPHVELGTFAADDVPALIIPEGLAVSLLGQSFLSQIGRLEIDGDTMRMSS